nr:MAG TPA: hypothetical protein [Caudoviricetes sp.]
MEEIVKLWGREAVPVFVLCRSLYGAPKGSPAGELAIRRKAD